MRWPRSLRTLRAHTVPFCAAVLATVSVAALAITPQKKPTMLRNGEAVDLRGTLAIEHRGWNQFLVLRTADPFALAPNAEVAAYPIPHPVVREFGLTLAGQDARLARLAGKSVRVSGRLQFTPGATYLWNDTLVRAIVIGLAGGVYLDSRSPEPGLALTIHRYTATTTLRPDSFARTYTARDLDTRKPLARPNLAGCNPSPAGDRLNCACADGFHATAGTLHTAHGDLSATMTPIFAQFTVGEPAATPITAEVECARNPAP